MPDHESRVLREAREAARRAQRRYVLKIARRESEEERKLRMRLTRRDRLILALVVAIAVLVAFTLLDEFWPRIMETEAAQHVAEAVTPMRRKAAREQAPEGRSVPVEATPPEEETGGEDEGEGEE